MKRSLRSAGIGVVVTVILGMFTVLNLGCGTIDADGFLGLETCSILNCEGMFFRNLADDHDDMADMEGMEDAEAHDDEGDDHMDDMDDHDDESDDGHMDDMDDHDDESDDGHMDDMDDHDDESDDDHMDDMGEHDDSDGIVGIVSVSSASRSLSCPGVFADAR